MTVHIDGLAARSFPALAAAAVLSIPVLAARAEDDAQALARLRKEIAAVVGDAACGNVSFCSALPMGRDACGSPTAWIAFNNAPELRIAVETKVAEVTFIEEDQLRGRPRPADCRPATSPKPACVNHRCVLGGASY
jgi:hypothetical protein